MKAAWYEAKGPAAQVIQLGEQPDPQPQPGEVRVRVHVSAVNPSDVKNRGGARGNIRMPFPRIVPHQDGAGIIDRVGPGVDGSRVGERVWVYEATQGRPFGTAAQFTTVPAHKAVRLPEGVSFEHGACLGIPAMTAHRCVFAEGPIAGRTVLVQGGAGAVGFYAVQFARLGGAEKVIATVSRAEQAARALEAGAHAVINYKNENVVERVAALLGRRPLDRIVEVAAGVNLADDVAMLGPGGVIAAYGSDAIQTPNLPFYAMLAKDLTLRTVLVYAMSDEAHAQAVDAISAHLLSGALKHQIQRIYDLDEIVAAHEACEAMKNLGKLLIRLP
ncbi:MAG: NADPH:quinone reductase [Betaproteobacteria bacterium]